MTLYEVDFIDGTTFKGGNLKNTKWNDMPLKFIKKLKYSFMGKKIILSGFDAYNHIKFYGSVLNQQKGKDFLYKVVLMASKNNATWLFTFDLINHIFIQDRVVNGQENNGKPVSGWKIGARNKPTVEIK